MERSARTLGVRIADACPRTERPGTGGVRCACARGVGDRTGESERRAGALPLPADIMKA